MDKIKYKKTIKGIDQTFKTTINIKLNIRKINFNLFSDHLKLLNFRAIRGISVSIKNAIKTVTAPTIYVSKTYM
jgi:hypothetical protein